MWANKIRALHGYRTRHYSASKPSVFIPDLIKRNFDVTRPNKVWVTDITYIRTWEGWLYLAVVMDLFSRKIVGWSTRPTIHRDLVLDAVMMAVRQRRPRGTVIHSDQGCQGGGGPDAAREISPYDIHREVVEKNLPHEYYCTNLCIMLTKTLMRQPGTTTIEVLCSSSSVICVMPARTAIDSTSLPRNPRGRRFGGH
jgi:hypothetical protein